jgi:hypothetical protein
MKIKNADEKKADEKKLIISSLKELIKKMIRKEMDEASGTGAVAGFQTPYAFSKKQSGNNHKDMGNVKAATTSTGYTRVDEKVEKKEKVVAPKPDAKPAAKPEAKPVKKIVPVGKETTPDVVKDKKHRGVNKNDLYILTRRHAIAVSQDDEKLADHYQVLIDLAKEKLKKSINR